MFQYEFEKRPASAHSCESQATVSTDWSRSYMDRHHRMTSRPLPPRPIHDRIPVKPTVPLKVWIVASASCFAVCAVLVLATVVVTRWGTSEYTAREIHSHEPEPIYSEIYSKSKQNTEEVTAEPRLDEDNELPILEKLSFFKNIVNRNRNVDLKSKAQIQPIHEAIEHKERKIEKKDKPKPPINYDLNDINNDNDNDLAATETDASEKLLESEDNNFAPISFNKKTDRRIETLRAKNNDVSSFDVNAIEREIKNIGDTIVPEFKPLNSEVLIKKVKLPVSYLETLRTEVDYDEYYNDINLYDDYMQSNTMTSYLIEKVQELHSWLTKDSDFDVIKNSTKNRNDFGEVLKALNESLIEGNASVVLNKLKEIYFGENFTIGVHGRRSMLGNETDLLSFGILSLDVMLLHNIQTMAWESQETARINMMKDPNVFAFNALFMDPSKVEAKMNEQNQPYDVYPKRQNKLTPADDYGFGKNLFENILEIGMGTSRAAIHLGRVYKNTRSVLNQMSNKENTPVLPRNIDENTHALNRLQSSYSRNGSVASSDGFYTELDCVWLLYCRNLAATSKLNPPYGTMARINGVALRMLAGELSGDKALDTMLYEVFAGWTELKCDDMFPKCSKVNAASVVLETILQPAKKTQ
ncbi:uncharacterized protein LOC101741272 [Bombyx mori]|uniref:Uncharacterized protein n=1 Tax=Bombyx mori TaxID=7091 RepID=A0A8R2LYZ5_BOMMO|nr:uncharacterized protein LOC101741272 [Bombyx mori]XP_037869962.1 uncharacterized protein LOC101741272 [Bombyx mori]